MTVPLPYTLIAKRSERYIPAFVMFLLPGIPALIFLRELTRDDEEPGAFGTSGMIALVAVAVPLLAWAIWFTRRVVRMSVTVDTDVLTVDNLLRSYSIPLSEVLWFEERLRRGNGKSLPSVEVRVQRGERSVRLDAASAHPDAADEFQADLIEALQQLSTRHGFRVNLINPSGG